MSQFAKISLTTLLVLPLGCSPTRGTANPEDYFPLIQLALGGGETAAMIGRNEAVKARNFPGCVASGVLAEAFDASGRVLGGRLQGQVTFPALEVDVSECLALRGSLEGASAHLPAASVWDTEIAGFAAEPETDGTLETEEPVSDTPAEEPAGELALSGADSDAAVLVDAIAGVTIAAALHYATKLKAANCEKGTAALGAIHYVSGMIKPIADEIANPDGKLSAPAVVIDLNECVGA